MFLKGLIAAVFESSEPLHLLRLRMGMSAPSLHRESTDSLIPPLPHICFMYATRACMVTLF